MKAKLINPEVKINSDPHQVGLPFIVRCEHTSMGLVELPFASKTDADVAAESIRKTGKMSDVLDNTEANIASLRAAWKRWLGDTHGMSFDQYVTNAFQGANRGLRRCGIKEWATQAEWLAYAQGVI